MAMSQYSSQPAAATATATFPPGLAAACADAFAGACFPACRYPFLLVDRVLEWECGKYAVGYKNVTANDNFFPGHFPQRAIMPGACTTTPGQHFCSREPACWCPASGGVVCSRAYTTPNESRHPSSCPYALRCFACWQAFCKLRRWPSWAAL